MKGSRRDLLLDTAVRLFRQHGYHATGVDRIVAEAGVAKMTLYKHFRSKDELILAALRRWDEQSRAWLVRAIEERAQTPRERLLALFDVLDEWFCQRDFNGCMFVNAAAEFGDRDDPIHRFAAEHKLLFLNYLREQARRAGAGEPDRLAEAVALLMEGAIVSTHVSGKPCGARARSAAALLLDHALAAPARVVP